MSRSSAASRSATSPLATELEAGLASAGTDEWVARLEAAGIAAGPIHDYAEVFADPRAMVLRGAGGKAFVAGTDIQQFTAFETAADGVEYEATIDRIVGRLESVGKPTVALVDGLAMGSGLALSATCDLHVCTPAARFGLPIARTVGNCLSMADYARLAALLGPARLKEIVFTARR